MLTNPWVIHCLEVLANLTYCYHHHYLGAKTVSKRIIICVSEVMKIMLFFGSTVVTHMISYDLLESRSHGLDETLAD